MSRRRVARLMCRARLRAKAAVHQLYARHPNRLWGMHVDAPNQAWVGDITYLKVGGSWRYLGHRDGFVLTAHPRGSEYMGAPFCAEVIRLGFLQSASVRGPGDNAHAESFFHSLKAELIRGVSFSTARRLRAQLHHYIRYYNATRLHSSREYLSPLAFERRSA